MIGIVHNEFGAITLPQLVWLTRILMTSITTPLPSCRQPSFLVFEPIKSWDAKHAQASVIVRLWF